MAVSDARASKEFQTMSESLFLRIDDAAKQLGVSRQTVYDLIRRNTIPAVRLAGRGDRGMLRVPADALKKLAVDAMRVADGKGDE
jgi:excisionase family DNA binding protein